MKKNIFSVVLCLLLAQGFSQTSKGNLMIGGNLGFQKGFGDNNKYTSLYINPTLAFFPADNLAVGSAVTLNYYTSGDQSSFSYGLGPLVRYYIGSAGFRPFAGAQFSVGGSKYTANGVDLTGTNWGFNFGPGIAFFVNDHVALELTGTYNYTKNQDVDGHSDLFINFGVQAYLGGK